MSNIEWLQEWYQDQCDGDWEHMYGITISTLDNPGWDIEIDLAETAWSDNTVDFKHVEINSENWYQVRVVDSKFIASGDLSKLPLLIGFFRSFVETGEI